jgi:hypothetical protein
LRLSDAERELLYEKLKRHAAEGRLSLEDLEHRVALVAAAQTRDAAAIALADLPPLAARPPRPRSGWTRGHGEVDEPAPDWHPTDERFRDPRSNKVMRVWVDSDGARHYVVDDS